MSKDDLNKEEFVLLFIETKVNHNHKELETDFIPIEKISPSIREVWEKEWEALNIDEKQQFLKQKGKVWMI